MIITSEMVHVFCLYDHTKHAVVKHYENKEFTTRQFMDLKKITHDDKVSVAFRHMPKKNIRLAAADIAELVLPVFEAAYPHDNRPRLAIEAARTGTGKTAAIAAQAAGRAASSAVVAATVGMSKASEEAAWAAWSAQAAAWSAQSPSPTLKIASEASINAKHAGANLKAIRTIILRYWK